MRIVQTTLLSVAFLGATISDGWCPEPADLTSPIGSSTGATGAAVSRPYTRTMGYDPSDPRNVSREIRRQMLPRERAAGRVTNEQEEKNFLQTGDPRKSYTPPERKPLTKPPSMSDAQWQRILATRPKPQNDLQGKPGEYTVEQSARRQRGTVTTTAAPAATTPAPAKPPASAGGTSATATAAAPPRGDRPMMRPPEANKVAATGDAKARLTTSPASSAMDRLGGGPSYGAPAGATKKPGSFGTTPLKSAQQTTPQVQPRPSVTPPPSRGPDRNINYGACPGCGRQDTFRQPR